MRCLVRSAASALEMFTRHGTQLVEIPDENQAFYKM